MKLLNIFVLVFGSTIAIVGVRARGRIFNGTNAYEAQVPSQARLEIVLNNGDKGSCGGSVINHNWILTAAHCVEAVNNITIYLGSIRRNESYVVLNANANDVIIHAYYNSLLIRNDIALIKTSYIPFDQRVQPVTLPKKESAKDLYVDRYVTICGWGRTGANASTPTMNLQCTNMQVIPNEVCIAEHVEELSIKIRKSNLCANGADGTNTRTCQGDSGSPMILNGTDMQIGMSSFGSSAGCDVNLSRVYTRITSYLDWINSRVE